MAPLDVDEDAYWSWNPGYVALTVGGQVQSGGAWKPFVYHVGGDDHRAKLQVHVPIHATEEQTSVAGFVVDVNKLFVTPEGIHEPSMELRSRAGAPPAHRARRPA